MLKKYCVSLVDGVTWKSHYYELLATDESQVREYIDSIHSPKHRNKRNSQEDSLVIKLESENISLPYILIEQENSR